MKGWLKNILIFLAGMAAMFIIMLTLAPAPNDGLTLFKDSAQEKVIDAKKVKIFQVLEPNKALANITNKPNEIYDPDEILVLIIGDEKTTYYDDEKINISDGQYLKQIGIYQYVAKSGNQKTVPAVSIISE